ncbi:hypothetical protein ASG36_12240 [Geodermatophilus sp. Leaf369]|uniref:hypothetical protein n=1 Tax=Geodermatophilus sp. Leaf369 TaxID=1736354 RepID=UPI0006FE09E2|nr:hypothetical protein [Geodermatophilus sp. Leaf369]KQS58769.1 hypothetical protein ASG36_12240 [Geodermatophilus sp. Leaf369]
MEPVHAGGARGLPRALGAVLVLAGVLVSSLTTGRGSPWATVPAELVANDLTALDPAWWATVVVAVAGTWLGAWVALAALPRGVAGRVLVTVVYVLPPAPLALDALQVGGQDAVVAVVLLLVLWPVPLLLLWTGRHARAAATASGLALAGLLGQAVVVGRLLVDGAGPTGELWLATGGVLAVAVGAGVLLRGERVSP